MHRRSLSIYTHILFGKNVQSEAGRCGQSARVLRQPGGFRRDILCGLSTNSSLGLAAPKSPATVVKAKETPPGTKEDVFSDIRKEIPNQLGISEKKPTFGEVVGRWPRELSMETGSEEGSPSPFPALLENAIVTAKSAKEVLNLSVSSTLILKHACLIIFRLGQLSRQDSQINFESLSDDGRFMRICNLIQRANFSQSPQSLFFALNGLQRLGVAPASDVFKTLGTELKWALRRCPVRFLARAIELFSGQEKCTNKSIEQSLTKEAQEILDAAIDTLQLRWVEVATASDFISVFKILNFLNDETRGKLEDRAVELVLTFSPPEMRKIFVVLGAQRRRPTPLLRALAFHLSKSEDKTSAKDLIELTYALNELTFADPVLMEKVCSNLCPEIPSVDNPALISSLTTSLGQMRYKHKGLLQIVDEWIMNNLSSLRPFDYAAWLMTCAVLNYRSDNKSSFCKQAKVVLSRKSSHDIEWVNIVHALLVLDEHSEELLASTLKPEISNKIDSLGDKSSKTKIKLLQINSMANSLLPKGYKGPLLDSKYKKEWTATYLGPSDRKLTTVVVETLGNFLPASKYLQLNQKLECGVFADVICYFTDKIDPVPVAADLSKIKYSKMAIVVEGYSSLCLGAKEPTGNSILNRNLLTSNGYRVVVVPYTEFSSSEKLLRRVKYLEEKVKLVNKQDA